MTTNLISETLIEALQNQMVHEIKNAHIYLFVSGYLNSKGMNKIASFFSNQYNEELEHFKLIFDFLVDMDVVPSIIEIDETNASTLSLQDNIISIASKFIDRETITTSNLGEILGLCIDESNFIAEQFIRGMIGRQQAEYAEATEFMDKANLCGSNWMNVLIWNNSFE